MGKSWRTRLAAGVLLAVCTQLYAADESTLINVGNIWR